MDFISIIAILVLYIIRPQEWMPEIESLHLVSLAVYVAMVAMFLRQRGFSLRSLLQTPHDYAMLIFFGWIIYCGEYWRDDYEKVKGQFLFYILTVQALSNIERLEKYLAWWTGLLVLIAGLALASEVGFDPAHSFENTHGMFMGRLVFHNGIFNNPNALGHGIVPAVGMVYFFFIWKRPFFVKEAGLVLIALILGAVFLTQSKGAFLSGFAAIVTTLCFGRPKSVQVLILIFALTLGVAGLQALPRMQEMETPRQDAGIRGRLQAFQYGLNTMRENKRGVGIYNFASSYERSNGIFLSPHSSYVGMGAELGWMGMYFYLASLYCSLRVLVTARTTTPAEERARRILMVLNISFMVSTWLINWGTQSNYWFIAAATAAFHRILLAKKGAVGESAPAGAEAVPADSARQKTPEPGGLGDAIPVPGIGFGPEVAKQPSASTIRFYEILKRRSKGKEKNAETPGINWSRMGLIDLALLWLMTTGVVEFWAFIVTHL